MKDEMTDMTPCEYCGQEARYGHNAVCVMNEVIELRAENERLHKALDHISILLPDRPDKLDNGSEVLAWEMVRIARRARAALTGREGGK